MDPTPIAYMRIWFVGCLGRPLYPSGTILSIQLSVPYAERCTMQTAPTTVQRTLYPRGLHPVPVTNCNVMPGKFVALHRLNVPSANKVARYITLPAATSAC